jgi:hypothetical protein
MNIIHNNQNNISVYHFLSLYIKENIDDYYLENSSGRILSNEDIVENGEKYTIREKCKGGSSLNQSGNSFIITMGSAIIYSIITIMYYNYYITNILIGKYCDIPDVNVPNVNLKNISGPFGKKGQIPGFPNAKNAIPIKVGQNGTISINKKAIKSDQSGGEGENSPPPPPEEEGTFKFIMKEYLKRFICHIKDNCYETFMSDSFPHRKEKVIKNTQMSLGSILSFAIFAVFIFMLMAPLFLNSATKISCGKPKMTSSIFAIIFILLPIAICKFIPKIILFIEDTAKKYGKDINLGEYKIAISNTLLLILLIVYMIISKGGLSKMMYAMFPIALLVFIGIKFIPTIPDIIHGLSKFFSNNITTINPPVGDVKPEESKRYTFFYTVFEIAIFSLIGWILYTIAFIGQVQEFCPST